MDTLDIMNKCYTYQDEFSEEWVAVYKDFEGKGNTEIQAIHNLIQDIEWYEAEE